MIQRGVDHFWSRTRRFVFLPEDCSFVNPLMRSEFGSLWFVWGELKFDWFQTIRNYWLHGSGFWVDIVRKTDYRRGIFHAFVAIEEMAGADRDCGSHLSDSETIPTRYGRATESSILASSELCTGAWLSYLTSNSSIIHRSIEYLWGTLWIVCVIYKHEFTSMRTTSIVSRCSPGEQRWAVVLTFK